MSEIKPRMVDGEARCDEECGEGCDSYLFGSLCAPYYRARVSELEGDAAGMDSLVDMANSENDKLSARVSALEATIERVRDHLHLGSYDGTVDEHGIHALLNIIDGAPAQEERDRHTFGDALRDGSAPPSPVMPKTPARGKRKKADSGV